MSGPSRVSTPLRVVKLGGSLLTWPELVPRLRDWLNRQTPATNVLVVGGGALVDALRQLDAVSPMSNEAAHWLAIRAMSLTADVVAQWTSEAPLVKSLDELREASPLAILDVEPLLHRDAASRDALPCGWHVTSDSIAARVARIAEADELVLLKSSLPAEAVDRAALARCGLVDAYFEHAARGVPLRVVDLRGAGYPERKLEG